MPFFAIFNLFCLGPLVPLHLTNLKSTAPRRS